MLITDVFSYVESDLKSQRPVTGQTTRLVDLDTHLTQIDRSFCVVRMQQVHEATVKVLSSSECVGASLELDSCDGVISAAPHALLTVRTADCLPILIWHPSGVKAALHAGRKSTESEIMCNVFHILKNKFNVTNSFSIWFGPRLCASCHQIDRDLDIHYDLNAQNEAQLRACLSDGDYHLSESPFCTKCRSDLFYSYRFDGSGGGRLYSFIL